MPTLNELLFLGSRPKQLLLCLITHWERECSPYNLMTLFIYLFSLNIMTIKSFTKNFLGSNVIFSARPYSLLIFYQIPIPIYAYINIHSNIFCIAITGNKILCLIIMPYAFKKFNLFLLCAKVRICL
jgi:hypothetical protein